MRFLHTNRRITSYPAYERFNNNYRATHPIVDGLLGWYRTDYMNTDQITNGSSGKSYEGVTRIHNRWGSLSDLVPATDNDGNKLYPKALTKDYSSRRFAEVEHQGHRKYLLEDNETISPPLTLTVGWSDPDVAILIDGETRIECGDATEDFIVNGSNIYTDLSTDGGMNMISIVWENNDSVSIWMDGNDLGNVSHTGSYKNEVFNGDVENDGNRYGCNIAEWLFHDRALSSSEIQQEHNRMRAYFTGDRDKYHRRNYS